MDRTNKKENPLDTAVKFWLRLLEWVKANPLKGCIGTAKKGGEIYWISNIEQKLERLVMGAFHFNISFHGIHLGEEKEYHNDNKVWIRMRKTWVGIGMENMEAIMRKWGSLILYNSLNENWEKEEYIKLSTERNIVKNGVWRLKNKRRFYVQRIYPIYSTENCSHILRYEGTKVWGDQIMDKRYTDAELGFRRIVWC